MTSIIALILSIAAPALPPRAKPQPRMSAEMAECIDEHVGNLDEDEAADLCAEEME